METLIHEIELVKIVCGGCGISFAMPKKYQQTLFNNHNTFYCPRGCVRHYPGQSDNEKLKKKIDLLSNRLRIETEYKEEAREELKKEKLSKRAIKSHHTRLKNRIKNGVCPCCKRTFKNLSEHMDQKHPNFIQK